MEVAEHPVDAGMDLIEDQPDDQADAPQEPVRAWVGMASR
jgi:hypothetical protein